jgi:hypothetical protein
MSIRVVNDDENPTINRATIANNGAANLPSLGTLIPPQLRQQFSKKLFDGDAGRLEELLARLEMAPNWRTAHILIGHYFHRHQISPYHAQASRFSDLIYKRYFPNDAYV